jgi:hypothetical protein
MGLNHTPTDFYEPAKIFKGRGKLLFLHNPEYSFNDFGKHIGARRMGKKESGV